MDYLLPVSYTHLDKIGQILGIGYGNAKQFLSRLNNYGVSREEFVEAVNSIDNTEE